MSKQKLPVGMDGFEKIRRNGFYYIDKTKLIEQLFLNWGEVNLFTRPRRFGKTLNMSMLKSFFEIGTDPSLFEGLYISGNQAICEQHMGQYPVIFLSLKNVEGSNFERAKDDPEAKPEAYWINTSGNDLVKRFIDKANKTTKNEIERLINGEAIEKELRLDLTYEEIDQSIENLWSVLFTTGYLTQAGRTGNGAYRLIIPNREVREVFRLQINEWFQKSIFTNTERLTAFWKAFEEGDTEGIEQYLNRVLSNSISIFDTKARKEEKESSYHNLLVGILTGNADWLVKSNVEAGEGFADIIVETDDPVSGIVAELKYTKDFGEMEAACQKALQQIKDRRYQEYLLNDGRKDIQLYGFAFCKKRCRAICERL